MLCWINCQSIASFRCKFCPKLKQRLHPLVSWAIFKCWYLNNLNLYAQIRTVGTIIEYRINVKDVNFWIRDFWHFMYECQRAITAYYNWINQHTLLKFLSDLTNTREKEREWKHEKQNASVSDRLMCDRSKHYFSFRIKAVKSQR